MERQKDLDIAKGIGIILVVWAHASGPFSDYIYQFHMPLFFFISGMLYRSEDKSNKEYIQRKVKSLLIPFLLWNLLLYPIYFVLYYWKQWSVSVCIKEISTILLTLWKVPFLGATWFLPSLFWVSILVHVINKKTMNIKFGNIILLLIGLGISFIGFNINLPYRISRTMILMMFYVCGYLFKQFQVKTKTNNRYIYIYI